MRLVDVISQETGEAPQRIMLLRHYNDVEKLLELGGSIDEFTSLQPTGSRWDFWSAGEPQINVVAVVFRDVVEAVYRISGIEREGTVGELASPEHVRFNIELKRGKLDLPARRFKVARTQSAATGMAVRGWKGREIRTVLRATGNLFWEIEVDLPATEQPTETVDDDETFFERPGQPRTVNVYDRNSEARTKCIQLYGAVCAISEIDFAVTYGPDIVGLIHVHHNTPRSTTGHELQQVGPGVDLTPVCPNCHAVIHWGGGCRSVDEVRQMLAAQRRL